MNVPFVSCATTVAALPTSLGEHVTVTRAGPYGIDLPQERYQQPPRR
jgi:hypothetical protein